LQRADDLRAFAFEDADDRTGFLLHAAIGSQPARADLAPNEHAVPMQRRAGVAFGNHDLLHGRIVGPQKPFALAIDLNRARDEIGFLREDVAIAFGAGDLAGLLQLAQLRLQLLLAVGLPAQLFEHLRHVGGRVVFLSE
jgi:hypothetical protein